MLEKNMAVDILLENCGTFLWFVIFHSVCIFWIHYYMVKPHGSNFSILTANFWGSEIIGFLMGRYSFFKMESSFWWRLHVDTLWAVFCLNFDHIGFLAHLSRRFTRWAYGIPMVRRPFVVVCRQHIQTWISLKLVGQLWSNYMRSITGLGERLHKVLGQIGLKLGFLWQQKAPIDLLLGKMMSPPFLRCLWSDPFYTCRWRGHA